MKIVSWNILADEFINVADYPGVPVNLLKNREQRLKSIKKVIAIYAADADLLLLQEVMPEEADAISRLLRATHTPFVGPPIVWDGDNTSVSRNVTLVKDGFFTSTPDCVAVDGAWIITGDDIAIANVHLNAEEPCQGDHASDAVQYRTKQIEKILMKLSVYRRAIIGGDFNQHYDDDCPLYKKMTLDGFTCHIRDPTYTVDPVPICIDQIATRGWPARQYGGVISQGTSFITFLVYHGSDHHPVFVGV